MKRRQYGLWSLRLLMVSLGVAFGAGVWGLEVVEKTALTVAGAGLVFLFYWITKRTP